MPWLFQFSMLSLGWVNVLPDLTVRSAFKLYQKRDCQEKQVSNTQDFILSPPNGRYQKEKRFSKNLFLSFVKIGPPSKTHAWDQKWGHRTERGFGPGRWEEWHQLSHNQRDWAPSELSMCLLYHQHAVRNSGVWALLKLRATAGYLRPLSQGNWEVWEVDQP